MLNSTPTDSEHMQMPSSKSTTILGPSLRLQLLTLTWTAQTKMKAVFNQICSQFARGASVCQWLDCRHHSCLRPVVQRNLFTAFIAMLICLIEQTHEQLQDIQISNIHPPLHLLENNPTGRSLRHPMVIELYSPIEFNSRQSKLHFYFE